MFRKLMAAINAFLAVGVLAFGTPAQAQAVKAGIMTCNVAGGFGFIFGSSRAVNCTFAPDGVAPQHYVGAINKFGVDIGYVEGAVMAWAVLAPTNNPGPGLLAGARARNSASLPRRTWSTDARERPRSAARRFRTGNHLRIELDCEQN